MANRCRVDIAATPGATKDIGGGRLSQGSRGSLRPKGSGGAVFGAALTAVGNLRVLVETENRDGRVLVAKEGH